jgi:hypothetical protein
MKEHESPFTDDDGTQFWYNAEGWLHREDGPAVIWTDGDEEWYQDGLLHRMDGPAVIHSTGEQQWFVHDVRHRLTGPARIYADGDQEWYINDRLVTNEVNTWMTENNITYPWDEHTQVEFVLRWG